MRQTKQEKREQRKAINRDNKSQPTRQRVARRDERETGCVSCAADREGFPCQWHFVYGTD